MEIKSKGTIDVKILKILAIACKRAVQGTDEKERTNRVSVKYLNICSNPLLPSDLHKFAIRFTHFVPNGSTVGIAREALTVIYFLGRDISQIWEHSR